MPVIYAGDVRDELGFDERAVGLSESEFDALLSTLIERESVRVADAISVTLGVETTTEVTARPHSVPGHDLPLSNRPVQSVTSVSLDTDRVSGPTIAADDYEVHDTHLELLPGADRDQWPTTRRAVTVEYDHGYAEGDVPEPIAGAILGLVRAAVQEIEADGIESESIEGDSVSYEPRDQVVRRHISRAQQFDEPEYYDGTQVI